MWATWSGIFQKAEEQEVRKVVSLELRFEATAGTCEGRDSYNARAADRHIEAAALSALEKLFYAGADAGERTEIHVEELDAAGLEDRRKSSLAARHVPDCAVRLCSGGCDGAGGFDADSLGAAGDEEGLVPELALEPSSWIIWRAVGRASPRPRGVCMVPRI